MLLARGVPKAGTAPHRLMTAAPTLTMLPHSVQYAYITNLVERQLIMVSHATSAFRRGVSTNTSKGATLAPGGTISVRDNYDIRSLYTAKMTTHLHNMLAFECYELTRSSSKTIPVSFSGFLREQIWSTPRQTRMMPIWCCNPHFPVGVTSCNMHTRACYISG